MVGGRIFVSIFLGVLTSLIVLVAGFDYVFALIFYCFTANFLFVGLYYFSIVNFSKEEIETALKRVPLTGHED